MRGRAGTLLAAGGSVLVTVPVLVKVVVVAVVPVLSLDIESLTVAILLAIKPLPAMAPRLPGRNWPLFRLETIREARRGSVLPGG